MEESAVLFEEKNQKRNGIELAAVAVFAFVVVIAAPALLPLLQSEGQKVFVRCLLYVLLAAAPLAACRIRKRPFWTLGFRREEIGKQVLFGFAIFAMLAALVTVAVILLGSRRQILLPLRKSGPALLSSIAFDLILVGPVEETLFRGYFLNRLQVLTRSGAGGIIFSSILFGAWHFPGGQDILQVLLTAVIGALFSYCILRFRNCTTLSVMIAHGLHDSFLLVLSCILL